MATTMARPMVHATFVLALASSASSASAQVGPPGGSFGGGSNPHSGGNGPPSGVGGQFGPPINVNKMVTVHAVLATRAFGLLFPSGSILIRLGSFRDAWLVHGIIQVLGYIVYIAAAAAGLYIAVHRRMLSHNHPIFGIALLVLLFFQPFLGWIHHVAFRKYSRRTVWSCGHIWLGRILITLGIVNGGLGLSFSQQTVLFAPKHSTVIGYSVAAAIVWLIWVVASIYGEIKRRKIQRAVAKEEEGSMEETQPPTYATPSERSDVKKGGPQERYA